jgi:hypothetical protein
LPGVTCHFSLRTHAPLFSCVLCNNAENNPAAIHYQNWPFTP